MYFYYTQIYPYTVFTPVLHPYNSVNRHILQLCYTSIIPIVYRNYTFITPLLHPHYTLENHYYTMFHHYYTHNMPMLHCTLFGLLY